MESRKSTEILEWLKTGEISNPRTDNHFIMRFLEGCKLRVDKAKVKMKNFYEMRRNTPEWFDQRDPFLKSNHELLELGILFPLPLKDEDGRTIIIVRATANDPKKNPMVDVFKVGMMIVDLALELDETIAKNGAVVIIDMQGVGLGHALQMTPNLIKKAVHSWQDCYPIRIKSIDFINCPSYIHVVLNVFKQFMREKLRKRVSAHGKNLANFLQTIDPKLLPEEYQGSCGSINTIIKDWKEKAEAHKQWFLDDITIKAQE